MTSDHNRKERLAVRVGNNYHRDGFLQEDRSEGRLAINTGIPSAGAFQDQNVSRNLERQQQKEMRRASLYLYIDTLPEVIHATHEEKKIISSERP